MELPGDHPLYGCSYDVLAKREDCDDILALVSTRYFFVHLTWSGKKEAMPFPKAELYESMEELKLRLAQDTKDFQ